MAWSGRPSRNYRKGGEAFLNRLKLAPLQDDEGKAGEVVYWAVLEATSGTQRLEPSTDQDFKDTWGPNYDFKR